jgi:predicted 3-demethylubiquinone-9 3-methyltransferase (glyoxalase superfamily)
VNGAFLPAREHATTNASRCGWLKDKFGVSWQIVPSIPGELLNDPDKASSQRAMKAVLRMVELDSKKLKNAFAGR